MSKEYKVQNLKTAGDIQVLLNESGIVDVTIAFGKDLVIAQSRRARLVSLALHEGINKENVKRQIVVDIPNWLFHRIQVQANIQYHQNVLGEKRSIDDFFVKRANDGAQKRKISREPKQKIMRQYYRPEGRVETLARMFAQGWGPTTTVAPMDDPKAVEQIFDEAAREGNENTPIYTGPFYNPESKEPLLVRATGFVRDYRGNEQLVIDLGKDALDLIQSEWRHALSNGNPHYPPVETTNTNEFWRGII